MSLMLYDGGRNKILPSESFKFELTQSFRLKWNLGSLMLVWIAATEKEPSLN